MIPTAVRHVSFRGIDGFPFMLRARELTPTAVLRGYAPVNRVPDSLPDYHVTVVNIPPWALRAFLALVTLGVLIEAAGFVYLGRAIGGAR